MEITYIGHSCFKIKGKNFSLVIDPYNPAATGYKIPALSADAVLVTHQHEDHNNIKAVSDYKIIIDSAGEYELSDTYITGIQTLHDSQRGEERGKNIIYQIEIDDFNLLHLGDLGHELATDTLEKLSSIDILMIPVGGVYTIDAKTASKIISKLEPSIIIPMHYQTPDLTKLPNKLAEVKEFLAEMGGGENGIKTMDKLKITNKIEVPEESQVYVLDPQH